MNQAQQNKQVTITQVTKKSGEYRHYVEITVAGELYMTKPAVTAEHSGIIADEYRKLYAREGANITFAWRGEK